MQTLRNAFGSGRHSGGTDDAPCQSAHAPQAAPRAARCPSCGNVQLPLPQLAPAEGQPYGGAPAATQAAKDGATVDIVAESLLFLRHNPKYVKLRNLASGTSGLVQLARNVETGEIVAIKFMERVLRNKTVILRELINLSECGQHPNVVQLKEILLMPHHLAIVMEYVEGGDLASYVHRHATPRAGIPEEEARTLFQQVLVAVDYCHQLGIALRDIKLDNVLVHRRPDGELHVKLCDFGFSKAENYGSGCKTACGTLDYMAPEILTSPRYKGNAADVWSLGVMLYVMVEGAFPFRVRRQQHHAQTMVGRIVSASYEPPMHGSPAVVHLLERMLMVDTRQRATVAQVMAHPWVQHRMPPQLRTINDQLQAQSAARGGRLLLPTIIQAVESCCFQPAPHLNPMVALLAQQIQQYNEQTQQVGEAMRGRCPM